VSCRENTRIRCGADLSTDGAGRRTGDVQRIDLGREGEGDEGRRTPGGLKVRRSAFGLRTSDFGLRTPDFGLRTTLLDYHPNPIRTPPCSALFVPVSPVLDISRPK
jgi:hypothetical protein